MNEPTPMPDKRLPMTGETVAITTLTTFGYGYTKGYKVQATIDGKPFARFEDFWELEDMLAQAGYPLPGYERANIIDLPSIEAVLGQRGNRYNIDAVRKLDNSGYVTRDEVLDAQRLKRERQAKVRKATRGMSAIEKLHYYNGSTSALLTTGIKMNKGWWEC